MTSRALLSALVGLSLLSQIFAAPSCDNVPEASRRICSALDGVNRAIPEDKCLASGCCFAANTSIPCFEGSTSRRLHAPDAQCYDGFRTDCGFIGIQQDECERSGCCWSPTDGVELPWCFFKQEIFDYSVVSDDTSDGKRTLMLQLNGDNSKGDVQELQVDISFNTVDQVRVKIFDPNEARFEVPQEVLPMPDFDTPAFEDLNYDVQISEAPFEFQIIRKSDGAVIFDSFELIFRQHSYISLSTRLPEEANIYGLGERVHGSFRLTENFYYTLWALDNPAPLDQNLYGHHPFYLEMRDGQAHGVFLNNANGMDVSLHNAQGAGIQSALQYHVLGGILDFHFFIGPNPEQAIEQYHEVIGKPHLPPYWSLGWHQCRYGFVDIDEVEFVVAEYERTNIPLETIWIDIDYMDAFEDFSTDPVQFPLPRVQEFIRNVHANNQFAVAIIDPAIHVREGYEAYDTGIAADIFTKDRNGEVFVGRVWPGDTTFPDWSDPNAKDWWKGLIIDWVRNDVDVDGIWIDMNEAANFCNGACYKTNRTHRHVSKGPNGVFEQVLEPARFRQTFDPNNPAYRINNAASHADLNLKTLDMDAQLIAGIEYDMHNIFGAWESIHTREAAEEMHGKRAFVLSRSTYAGSGAHVGHWLGDNFSGFNDLLWSVMGILSMNLFGVPLNGADICGFNGPTNEELCARWHALGVFYTFARNHNAIGEPDQEPYLWDSVTIALQNSLRVRYEILPWMYSLFYLVNENGGTVQRPLFFEFPEDVRTYDINDQFLFGSSFMVSPVYEQGETERSVYFPSNVWYSYWTGEREVTQAGEVTLQSRVLDGFFPDAPPVLLHVRGASIIPRQQSGMTLADARRTPFNLLVALDLEVPQVVVTETLFVDDGEMLDECVDGNCLRVEYTLETGFQNNRAVVSAKVLQRYNGPLAMMSHIAVLGLPADAKLYNENGPSVPLSRNSNKAYVDIPLNVNMNLDWQRVIEF